MDTSERGVSHWSTDPNANESSDPSINWKEGQLPSTVNNSARAMMARIKEFSIDLDASLNERFSLLENRLQNIETPLGIIEPTLSVSSVDYTLTIYYRGILEDRFYMYIPYSEENLNILNRMSNGLYDIRFRYDDSQTSTLSEKEVKLRLNSGVTTLAKIYGSSNARALLGKILPVTFDDGYHAMIDLILPEIGWSTERVWRETDSSNKITSLMSIRPDFDAQKLKVRMLIRNYYFSQYQGKLYELYFPYPFDSSSKIELDNFYAYFEDTGYPSNDVNRWFTSGRPTVSGSHIRLPLRVEGPTNTIYAIYYYACWECSVPLIPNFPGINLITGGDWEY